jgi:hypothetical protein
MSSATYTNRIRTQIDANLTKVQYPGRQSKSYNALQATIGCNPNYYPLIYSLTSTNCCIVTVPNFKTFRYILDGGRYDSTIGLDGGSPNKVRTIVSPFRSYQGALTIIWSSENNVEIAPDIVYSGGTPTFTGNIVYSGGAPINLSRPPYRGGDPTSSGSRVYSGGSPSL